MGDDDMRYVLDPGHGCMEDAGYDYGAIGQRGVREADIVLQIGRILGQKLNDAGHEVQMTRTTTEMDTGIDSLAYKCQVSNDFGADVFVSLHCNACDNPDAHGTETWYYVGSQNGQRLAQIVDAHMVALGLVDRGARESSGLYVLKHTDAVAVLVEIDFVSNPDMEVWLTDASNQDAVAQAIFDALAEYNE